MTKADAPGRLELVVQYAAPRAGLPARRSVARWLGAAMDRRARVTVRFVGAAEGRRLNREFRRRDYPTNVLTFVYSAARGGALEGDIVLCAPGTLLNLALKRTAALRASPLITARASSNQQLHCGGLLFPTEFTVFRRDPGSELLIAALLKK